MMKNFETHIDNDNIAFLYFDKDKASANTLSKEVLEELDSLLQEIKTEKPAGLVIASKKSTGFILGADIKDFTKLKTQEEAYVLIKLGQNVLQKLEDLPFTTVALIEGFCLGGGLELALACDFRIGDIDKARLGAPEVMLGIHPGFGGTVRLTHLVGSLTGMEMILTGRNVNAKRAKRIGLLDYALPSRHMQKAAKELALKKKKKRRLPLKEKIAGLKIVRPIIKNILHKKTEVKAPLIHYPAPHMAIDLWADYYGNKKKMYEQEAKNVSELFLNETTHHLIELFFLQENLKNLGKLKDYKPKHVHVIGAGVMGGDIAAWAALKGFTVTIQDREAKFIAPVIKRAAKLFKKKLKEKRLVQEALGRLIPDVTGERGIAKADVIIEAVFEDLKVKQDIFKDAEKNAKKDALLATNTSSIKIEDIASVLKDKGRLVGIHFFNPVALMPLIEVVEGSDSSKKIIEKALSFSKQMGKLPLPVKSAPGFLVNRCLMPYLLEAVKLMDEGANAKTIDDVALKYGMPMGPVLLSDTVGLDICLHVAEIISADIDIEVPHTLKTLVSENHLGKKTNQGFYKYKKGKAQYKKEKESFSKISKEDIRDRLILSMVNEAVSCLEETVISDEDLLDAGMVFGTGFAPFRAGPIHYIKAQGADKLHSRLIELEKTYGKRFTPHKGWNRFINEK